MSTFEREGYRWRETYFVMFPAARRPSFDEVERALLATGSHFVLSGGTADEAGRFESVTVVASDDFAAIDICYMAGEEVTEQGATLCDELMESAIDETERSQAEQVRQLDARFDVLHFEQVEGEEEEEMLDPSALLLVLDTLISLTDGLGIDPQSGSVIT